ncbi:MAG: hypothetical protein FWE25_09930 [Lachnospiraceae bacterium]|nr:hypothetical protein [Lachnospiraceae bacterium]
MEAMYQDEIILQKREENLKEQYSSLEEGCYVKGEIILFEKATFAERFSLMIPKIFMSMSEEYANIKYPSLYRPEYLLTNEDLTVNMGWTFLPNHMEMSETKQIAEQVQRIFIKEQDVFELSDLNELQKVEGHFFHFYQNTLDDTVYNVLAFVKVDRYLMQLNFNCFMEDYPDWENVVVQMWESVKYEKENTKL